MSTPPPSPHDTHPLSAAQVIAYLQDNPTFLSDHPDLLTHLKAPTTTNSKGVADFQTYMIERLKSDKQHIEKTTLEIIENVRCNINNQHRINDAILRLLDAETFDDFIRCITLDLAAMMQVDITALLVEAQGPTLPHIYSTGLRLIPEGTVETWMNNKPVLLQSNISGIESIFGSAASLVQSQILLRLTLSTHGPPALIAFGSRNPTMFTPDQATDHILFLGGVIERSLRTWLIHLDANTS